MVPSGFRLTVLVCRSTPAMYYSFITHSRPDLHFHGSPSVIFIMTRTYEIVYPIDSSITFVLEKIKETNVLFAHLPWPRCCHFPLFRVTDSFYEWSMCSISVYVHAFLHCSIACSFIVRDHLLPNQPTAHTSIASPHDT